MTHELDNGGLNEQSTNHARQGDFYAATANFTIKKSRVEATRLADLLRNKRIHAILEDNNGEEYYMRHFRIRATRSIAPARRGDNTWQFQIRSASKRPLPHIKDIPITGVIDCSPFYNNINIIQPNNTVYPTVLVDSQGNAIGDSSNTLLSDD